MFSLCMIFAFESRKIFQRIQEVTASIDQFGSLLRLSENISLHCLQVKVGSFRSVSLSAGFGNAKYLAPL